MDVELKSDVTTARSPRTFPAHRPKLTERITLRIPSELLDDLTLEAERRRTSLNDLCLDFFEHELQRLAGYRLDWYGEFRPFLKKLTELR